MCRESALWETSINSSVEWQTGLPALTAHDPDATTM
jgi:hypothetical protein